VTGRRLRCLDVPCDGCCELRASLRRGYRYRRYPRLAAGIAALEPCARRNCNLDLNNVASKLSGPTWRTPGRPGSLAQPSTGTDNGCPVQG
jgi:hypothetical protein